MIARLALRRVDVDARRDRRASRSGSSSAASSACIAGYFGGRKTKFAAIIAGAFVGAVFG